MIGLAFAAWQLAAAAGASALVIRDANHSVRVPIVSTANGPMIRPESMSSILPVHVTHDSANAYTVEIFGARLGLEAGVSSVRTDDGVRPLAAAPVVSNGHLLVPLQLVSDVFPGSVPNTRWDSDVSQLVVLTLGGVASTPGAPQRATDDPRSTERSAPVRRSANDEGRLPPVPAKRNRYTVVVDAGHGGVDNGMSGPIGGGPRIYEKNITLAVATRLGDHLALRGVDVVYTRTRDTLIALDDRGRIANRAAGNLFISIHVNAANPNWKDPGGSRGFETYFLSESRTEDSRRVEQMENSVTRFESATKKAPDDPLNFILSDMTQNEHLRESSELADSIQARLGRMHPGPSRGVKQAGFRVLVTAYMPAVLVEIGFGTNPREAAFLSEPSKQDAIAAAIADAAMAYLRRYEGRVAGAGGAPRT